MITLNQLRVFWAVAHSDSLTRAAKQLGVTQPALSQQLGKLENALGGQLFDRINNQLVLTDAGRFLLRKAETVLAEIDEAEAGLAEYGMGRKRRIAVGALASLARTIVPEAYRLALELVPTWSSTSTSWRRPRRWSSSTAAICRSRCCRRSRWRPTGSPSPASSSAATLMCSRCRAVSISAA